MALVSGLALAIACGTENEPPPYSTPLTPGSTVCGGHGTRYGGGGSCVCDEGYELDPTDITNCLPDSQVCGGHGTTVLGYDLEWTCDCDDGYELDPRDPLNCVDAGGGGGGGGTLTCESRDVEYGMGGSSTTNCTFSWAACSDGADYSVYCDVYYVSGYRIVECDCQREGLTVGEPFYPDDNICLIESWPTIEGRVAESCGWSLTQGSGGGGGECPVGTCTEITGGSVCLEGGGIPTGSDTCDPSTYEGCASDTVPVTYEDDYGTVHCVCLYDC
jgi:hypothetical protein